MKIDYTTRIETKKFLICYSVMHKDENHRESHMPEQSAVLRVGLTGNYGMGKSSVLRLFGELGARTIDADELVRGLLTERDVINSVRGLFGESVISEGKLDRAKIAEIIFRDAVLRRGLEDLLHPLVMKKIDDFIREAERRNPHGVIVIVEIPLLFERGYAGRFHKTITVSSQEGVILERLGRTGISKQDVLLRLGTQMSVGEKERLSDYVIDNSGNLEATRVQVTDIFGRLNKELKVRYGHRQGT